MTDHIELITRYFTEEKITSIFVMMIGILSVLLSLIFLFIIKYSFFKGMAIPLLIIGMIQLIGGVYINSRSPKDIVRVEQMARFEPEKIKTEELPRMQNVLHHFSIYKWIEISFIALGLLLFIRYYNSPQSFWKGLGLALVIQSFIILSIDHIASIRAEKYERTLFDYNIHTNTPQLTSYSFGNCTQKDEPSFS